MSYVYAEITVKGKERREIKALVDTGATYLVLDPKTVEQLGLSSTPYEVELTPADKRKAKAKLYVAEVEAEGRKGPVMVAEMDVAVPLLAVFALEALGLEPDLLSGRLEVVGPEGGYML
jgi:predicted aspartyl protease